MLKFLKTEANMTYTENGAVTYRSTHSKCLDLFAAIGALRRECEDEITSRFQLAYAENPDLAMKLLFYARDVRGGLGERRIFRTILKWLAENYKASVEKNLPFIAEYGRFDDLLILLGTSCEQAVIDLIRKQLYKDLAAMEQETEVSLLAKWLPSVNASNRQTVQNAKRIARGLGMNDAQYRKTLVKLREYIRIIENNLREKDYTFDYSKQPSKAMLKYRKAFLRNDGLRYNEFMGSVERGEADMHTRTLVPYEILTPFFRRGGVSNEERRAIDVTWNALEDFTNGENSLVVIDGSGSMYGGADPIPAVVAMSLGMYFAERNTGTFKNHFITFSHNPQLVEVKGTDILERLQHCSKFNEVANTDLQKVFELILRTAVKNRLPQSELPTTVYIVSDMEFDQCVDGAQVTNFERAKTLFQSYGYQLPQVVFWNVASRSRQQPVTMNEQGVALVSGCTPRLFSMISNGTLSPYACMMDVLGSERYAPIAA